MTSTPAQQLALSACLREASFRTPLIRHAAAKAATGRISDAPWQLSEAIRHTEEMLGTFKRQQLALGWAEQAAETPHEA